MSDVNISLDKTKTEVVITSGNVTLRYLRKQPEDGCIYIARENLPTLCIEMSEWDAVSAVISNWRAVTKWMNASKELKE